MKTQAQIDRATDLRLQRTYGISLSEYNQMLEEQNGVCAICGNPPKNRRLHVDHDHGWKRVKIIYRSKADGCCASTIYRGLTWISKTEKKASASRYLRKVLLKASVRGLLCAHCNRGLRYYKDNPVFMEAAAQYLRKHQGTLKAA